MKAIGRRILEDFALKHPDARPVLKRWYHQAKLGKWRTFVEVRQTFPSADYVKGFVIFDIGDYRLISKIDHEKQLVVVTELMTHHNYDRWRAK